ncbi:MAG TPA: ABC transporter permease, partial [Cyclobacteriaceae bacterium]|nr:ABC transporter permease [Cyclobacteriaceae bacterium]
MRRQLRWKRRLSLPIFGISTLQAGAFREPGATFLVVRRLVFMIKNYLTVAFRNFLKGRLYSIINVVGLAVGLTVFLFITVFVYHQLSYDGFHAKADRIYRIASHLEMGTNVAEMTATYPPMAAAMSTSFPEVEKSLRLFMQYGRIFKNGDKVFAEDVLYAGPEFFDVFSFNLLAGDPATALQKKYQVVLTRELVNKYFGEQNNTGDVIGKSIMIDGNVCEVTGVIQDCPENSHFHYTSVVSMESSPQGRDETWNNMNLSTYLLLHETADAKAVESKIPEVLMKHVPDFDKYESNGVIVKFFLQPLKSIHLHSNLDGELSPTGSIVTIYILGSIAAIVLLLACVNFMNLTTARGARRAKEVGIRKVLGSSAVQLVRQFTFETILMVVLATVLALVLVQLFRYPFVMITGERLSFDLFLHPIFIGTLIVFTILLGILAGSYPSFYLAAFKPVDVLKGKLRSGMKSSALRNGLVILQFAISITLITCTFVVQNQLGFMRSKKLGFDKDNLVLINNANKLPSFSGFENELKKNKEIVSVSYARFKPIGNYDGTTVSTEDDRANQRLLNMNYVGYDYFDVMKFEVRSGRGFSRDFPDSLSLVVNEAGANYLFGGDPIGKKVYTDDKTYYTVIGVVSDFNFESLKNEVKPLMFFLREDQQRFMHVRLAPGNHIEAIAAIEALWKSQHVDAPFTYTFVDDDFAESFKEEARLGSIFNVFTALALFIACLGLLGLAAFTAEQRTKEISVRKVLGASVPGILMLLSKDFTRLVLISV